MSGAAWWSEQSIDPNVLDDYTSSQISRSVLLPYPSYLTCPLLLHYQYSIIYMESLNCVFIHLLSGVGWREVRPPRAETVAVIVDSPRSLAVHEPNYVINYQNMFTLHNRL